ncbi:MAG: hypothetical protein JXQ27_00475 [Acidobacteria bacterium]|nr:hypothetical protein [Acidobacteriota bacterium]
MKRILIQAVLTLMVMGALTGAEDLVFKKVDYLVVENEEYTKYDVRFIFESDRLVVAHEKKPEKKTYLVIPYASVMDLSYERSAHHRPMPVGVPGLSGLPEYRHWLTIEYRFSRAAAEDEFAYFRLDKDNFQAILDTLEARCGLRISRKPSRSNNPLIF